VGDREAKAWLTLDIWAISLSAFFADLGYQAVQAGFPLFLVFVLHAPVWLYGVAAALSYGGGSFFAYLGGLLGDRAGHRRVALIGNSLIPLLSLSALSPAAWAAVSFLTAGWWARNARSPSRRAMLMEAVEERYRNEAFGFLHALDVAGGILAAVYVLVMLALHMPWRLTFLLTIIPLAASTYTLSRARTGGRPVATSEGSKPAENGRPAGVVALLVAAALYGLSYYSVGFPVLTVAERSHAFTAGILAFLLFQLVSALTGYTLGGRLGRTRTGRFRNLALWGYLTSAVGSFLLAFAYMDPSLSFVLFIGVAVLGFALGVVETLEPALMSLLSAAGYEGRGFGALTAARSLGLLLANLMLGLLYTFGAQYSYGYASLVALAAAVTLASAIPQVRRAERS
jgi:MFS family permease